MSHSDPHYPFLTELSQDYFRSTLEFDDPSVIELLARKKAILASNHAGMNFPWDAIVFFETLRRFYGGRLRGRFLASPLLFASRFLQPFGLERFWDLYCDRASKENFDRALAKGLSVAVHPEGVAGIAKGFDKRYRLQDFSATFIHMSLRHRAPIVPVYVINGEYLNPFAYGIKALNRLVNRLGLPFLPLGLTTILLVFLPFLAYAALPARIRVIVGKPIEPWHLEEEPRAISALVREKMQKELDAYVESHGRSPYDLRNLAKLVRKKGPRALLLGPWAWAFRLHLGAGTESKSGFRRALAFGACLSLLVPVVGWISYVTLTLVDAKVGRRDTSPAAAGEVTGEAA